MGAHQVPDTRGGTDLGMRRDQTVRHAILARLTSTPPSVSLQPGEGSGLEGRHEE